MLRDALGFEGFVVSDANAVRNLLTHGFAADLTDAGARGVSVGVDMEMAIADAAYGHLPEAIEAGMVSEEALDACVRRVLEAKLRLGLFEDPYVDEDRAREVLADPAHREVARIAAERSAVLLRNEGDLLPLDAATVGIDRGDRPARGLQARHARAVGASTSTSTRRSRCWTASAAASATGARRLCARHSPGAADVPVDVRHVRRQLTGGPGGLRRRRPSSSARSTSPREPTSRWWWLGEWQHMIGEAASRSSLELPGRQLELLRAVAETGTPVVLLVMNGRPLDLRWAAEHVPAILDIWYPGTQGGAAVANLLFGDVSPGGKLPFTWPRTVGQVPMIYSHTHSHDPQKQGRRYWDEESTPLFRFGHGLSYSRFEYGEPACSTTTRSAAGETVTVSVDVTNTGDRAGGRGGAALHPPAPRHGVPAGPRAQGLPADHARAGRDAHGRSSRWARPSCATGTRRRATGCSTPRPSTSGSAATRPRRCSTTFEVTCGIGAIAWAR